MNSERRKYPRVEIGGEVNIQIAGVIRNGSLINVSPAGIQIECRHQLIEQLAKFKSEAGLYPDFELEFAVPNSKKRDKNGKPIKSTCNVSNCRRLSQDIYHLGLNFVSLSEKDEQKVSDYIDHVAVA
ncbi:MAG: hypothetical protein GKR91_20095 [Pseudomonadales bacterium]|nr:hypothetical protein [Pseudomonadales bacterium]